MYENAEEVLLSIVAIVDKCPDQYKEKCFEVLLKGYVSIETEVMLGHSPKTGGSTAKPTVGTQSNTSILVPPTILPRLQTTAKRLNISSQQVESLFDFTKDPFGFHALAIPGEGKADLARKAALLVAFKSYLTSGMWIADWKEVQSMSIDQNCYDRKNHATFLRSGSSLFKTIEAGRNLELTSDGVKEAEKLVITIATGGRE